MCIKFKINLWLENVTHPIFSKIQVTEVTLCKILKLLMVLMENC